jgi:hypothetical protein
MGVRVGVDVEGASVGGMNDGVNGATGVTVGDGLGPQPFKARIKMAIRRNS